MNPVIKQQTEKDLSIHLCRRIPFEPVGIQLDQREAIRQGLLNLKSDEQSYLKITLVGQSNEWFDVENVVMYNIGTAYFQHLCKNGLCIEYPYPVEVGHNGYTYRYQNLPVVADSSAINHASLTFDFHVKTINSCVKPMVYWWAWHQGSFQYISETEPISGIEVDLTIHGPIHKIKNMASCLKSLLDGIISGLHYDENVDGFVIQYLASAFGEPEEMIKSLLNKQSYSLLGKRNLVQPYRNSIKWNPQDEICRKIHLRVDQDDTIHGFRITGHIIHYLW